MILVASMMAMVLSQAPTATLAGTVAGPDGRPVAGAEVRLAGLPGFDPPVLARGRTDAQGRFALERPAGLEEDGRYTAPILWVAKPGYRLAFVRLAGRAPGPGEPVRVALRPPGKAEVRIDRPDGAPLAGARVRIQWLGSPATYVPDEIADLLGATTNQEGRAVLDAGDDEEVTYVDVHSRDFGIQRRSFLPPTSQPKRVRLQPVGSLGGRLVADDPAMVEGWRVLAYTRTGSDPRNPEGTGFAAGTTDAEGRFAFPAIATGVLQLELKPPGDLPVLPDIPASLAVIGGRENSVDVPLRRAATVTGLVVESGSRRPIAGAEVRLYPTGGGMTRTAKTDDRGRYTFHSRPGRWTAALSGMPPTHALKPGLNAKDVRVPAGGARVEVEPLDAIPAAPPLRFAVRDEAGRPAAHAAVTGQSSSRYMPRTTDDRGEFAIPELPPGGQASVEVRLGGRITDGPVHATAGRTDPVPVTIVPGLSVAMAGRVLGPGGTPIPAAALRVEYRETGTPGIPFPRPVPLGDGNEVRTGPDGTFRTAKEIYRKGREFRAVANAEGFAPALTDWLSPTSGDLLTMPDLVLRRATVPRSIAGRVVDRDGKGVPDASVFRAIGVNHAAQTTDGEGRFRLREVPGGTALVFTEKAGFRFGGAIVGPDGATVEIRLDRAGDPPHPITRPRPPLSRAGERTMAREWLAPMVAESREGSLGRLGQFVLPALARVDPDRVLEMIESRAVRPTPEVLIPIVLAQFESDPAGAIATIEADRDPAARADGLLAIADAIPAADRARRIEWIDRALAEARRVEDRDSRLGLLGRAADRWLDLGRLDRARPILLEGRSILAAMPRDRYSPAAEPFAEVLAAIDLPTARPILEMRAMSNVRGDIGNMVKGHLAGAAVRLAATDPAEAERLAAIAFPNFSAASPEVLQVCRRMARADLPRARRILEDIRRSGRTDSSSRPATQPAGLGLMAMELAESDPSTSRKLLDETFDRLRQAAAAGPPGRDEAIPAVMAELLPMVERLEPDRLQERLWLTAAIDRPVWVPPNLQTLRTPVVLAMLVARYDRAIAAAIIAPALESLPGTLADSPGYFSNEATIIKALAAYDPRAVAALLGALPGSARKPPPRRDEWNAASLETQVRLAAAEALGRPADERWRWVLEGDPRLRFFGLPR